MKIYFKEMIKVFIAILSSSLLTFSCIELGLRFLHPEFKHLVNPQAVAHKQRIYINKPLNYTLREHLDTGKNHVVIHDSLGNRQHKLHSCPPPLTITHTCTTRNIAIMGDSFVENTFLPIQDLFTEKLDYLLNSTGQTYDVYSYGTSGYGPGQLYLQYMDEVKYIQPELVIYNYYFNDLGNLLANNLFSRNKNGELIEMQSKTTFRRIFRKILGRFYFTYWMMQRMGNAYFPDLLMDKSIDTINEIDNLLKRNRFFEKIIDINSKNEETYEALILFKVLMVNFAESVRQNGSNFLVCLIPEKNGNASHNIEIEELLNNNGINTINLTPYFLNQNQSNEYFFFKNDVHWNEKGNELTAKILFNYLANNNYCNSLSESFIDKAMELYNASFKNDLQDLSVEQNEIKNKYTALEKNLEKLTKN